MKTRRAYLVAPGKLELREVEIDPAPGQVMVKGTVCGLCNWELNHWKGKIGQCPQTLGHEWAGIVAEVGRGVKSLSVGDAVTGLQPPSIMTGFSDYLITDAALCHHVAPELAATDALGEPLKCVITVLRGAAPEVGDYGVVLGCGPMGLWCIQALQQSPLGALIAIDVSDAKLKLARKFGAAHTINPRTDDVVARVAEITDGHMADFVIEGTGAPEAVTNGLNCLRKGRGRLALMSYHERVGQEFDWRLVEDKSAIIMATHPGYSLDQDDDMRRAIRLFNQGKLRMDGVVNYRFPLENIQQAFETLENKPADYIKGVVTLA